MYGIGVQVQKEQMTEGGRENELWFLWQKNAIRMHIPAIIVILKAALVSIVPSVASPQWGIRAIRTDIVRIIEE